MRRSIVLALAGTLAWSGLLVGTASAQQCTDCDPGPDPEPPTVAVTLTLGATPVYGQDLHATVTTDEPEVDGGVSITWERSAAPDVVVASGEEGAFDIPTTSRFVPGQTYFLRASASKEDGSTGASARVGFTVDPITSALQFLTTTAAAGGAIQVRVNATTTTAVIPTGTVTLSAGGTSIGSANLDAQGVASFGGIQPGTYANAVAAYAGNGIYTAGTAAATVRAQPYTSRYAARLSATTVTQGDPVSVHVVPSGGVAEHPATGGWMLLAGLPGDDQSPIADGTSDGVTPFDVDVTDWARTHVGTWAFTLSYHGNAWVDGSYDNAFGQLTVAKRRMATVAELLAPVSASSGARVTARVTSTEPTGGVPTGAVTLYDGSATALATAPLAADGTATFALPATLRTGRHQLHVAYAGSADHLPSDSAAVTVDVRSAGGVSAGKAPAAVGGSAQRTKRTVRLTVVVTGRAPVTGQVQVRDGRKVVRTVTLRGGRAVVRLRHLAKGRHTLTASYLGSAALLPGQHRWTVRIR
jgi:hypothetical protein